MKVKASRIYQLLSMQWEWEWMGLEQELQLIKEFQKLSLLQIKKSPP